MANNIEKAAALLVEIKKMAGGNTAVLEVLEQKETEIATLLTTNPEELQKLINSLLSDIEKTKELNIDVFDNFDTQLARIELRYKSMSEDDQKKMDTEIDSLYISISKLDDKLVREAIKAINELENEEDKAKEIKKIVSNTDECLELITTKGFQQFDKKADVDVVQKWEKFKEELTVEQETSRKDLGSSKTIELDLRMSHHKGKVDFGKKEKLIEEIEKAVDSQLKKQFTEVIDEKSDITDFEKKWKVTVDEDLRKDIEKILDKQEKDG